MSILYLATLNSCFPTWYTPYAWDDNIQIIGFSQRRVCLLLNSAYMLSLLSKFRICIGFGAKLSRGKKHVKVTNRISCNLGYLVFLIGRTQLPG